MKRRLRKQREQDKKDIEISLIIYTLIKRYVCV